MTTDLRTPTCGGDGTRRLYVRSAGPADRRIRASTASYGDTSAKSSGLEMSCSHLSELTCACDARERACENLRACFDGIGC